MKPASATLPGMPYAFVQDVAASWHEYQRVTAATLEPAPAGLVLHLAGPTDEGFRIINVWESEAAWQCFRTERLAPASEALAEPSLSRPKPTFRELHATHVVFGERTHRKEQR